MDLFKTKYTQKQQVTDFIRDRVWVKTSDVIRFGVSIYCNSAERIARALAEEGIIKRMPDDLRELRFGKIKEEVWEWVER